MTTIALIDDSARQPSETFRPGTAQPAAHYVKLTAAMRRGINRTLDAFVPAAVGRQDPALAWRLAGPGLRAGGTLRQWRSGQIPVHPYAFAGANFHDWQLVYAREDRVAIDLILVPRKGSPDGPIAWGIDLVPAKAGWLVDSIFPAAVWRGTPKEKGGTTTTPAKGTLDLPDSHLGGWWLLVPAAILAASVLTPFVILARGLLRRRRPLEPLPPSPTEVTNRPS